jgi:glycosyltransferase involved in cell wall biosynthesis
MKVCHYLPSLKLNNGGPPRSVSSLCSNLRKNSLNVTIATTYKDNDPEIKVEPEIFRTNFNNHNDMRSYFKGNKFDVMHQHGIWLPSSHQFTLSAVKNDIPLVLAPRGMLMPWALQFNYIKKKIAWALYQKVDLKRVLGFHATAESEAIQIRKLGFSQPIAIIPNGVYENNVCPKIKKGEGVRKVLFLSRLHQKKGLELLLRAWSKINTENAVLEIIGNDEGGYKAKLIKIRDELGLGKNVVFSDAKYGEHKKLAFESADLFVLPSYSENFGIVVAEALSYGVPVITTKGCPWEEVHTNKCGWWVEPDVAELSAALEKSLTISSNDLTQMGQRGIQLIKNRYEWNKISLNMVEFYNHLLYKTSKPDFLLQ